MPDKTFQVVFRGETLPGVSVDRVKANIAQLFKVPIARIEPMFSGKPVVIKKNVNEATARKYLAAFKRAGAVLRVINTAGKAKPRPQTAAAPRPTVAKNRPAAGARAPKKNGAAKTGTGLTMAEAGATLVKPEKVQPLKVDLSGLSMDEPGVILVQPSDTPDLQVDISGLSMDEPGVVLVEPEKVKPPAIDTSRLSLKD